MSHSEPIYLWELHSNLLYLSQWQPRDFPDQPLPGGSMTAKLGAKWWTRTSRSAASGDNSISGLYDNSISCSEDSRSCLFFRPQTGSNPSIWTNREVFRKIDWWCFLFPFKWYLTQLVVLDNVKLPAQDYVSITLLFIPHLKHPGPSLELSKPKNLKTWTHVLK